MEILAIVDGTPHQIILDAGTGIRVLGDHLTDARRPVDTCLLLSHHHWDHIQGLPFFAPLYASGTRLQVIGRPPATSFRQRDAGGPTAPTRLADVLSHQMRQPVFPVHFEELSSSLALDEVADEDSMKVGPFRIRNALLNHPGGVLGFRVEVCGATIIYATDVEHAEMRIDESLAELSAGADVLIYDAMYTPEEHRGEQGPSRRGWGHSTFEAGAALARAAGVKRLVLFHHDPARTDLQVSALEQRAREQFGDVRAAREGEVIELCPEAA